MEKKVQATKRVLAWLLTLVMVLNMVCISDIKVQAATKIKVSSVKLNCNTYTLKKGKTLKLKATISPSKAKKVGVTWKSSKKSVATVNEKGKVKAVKNGKATITATAKGSKKKASCKIIVGTPVKKITATQSTLTLEEGKSAQINVKVEPSNASNKKLSYTSSDASVATVSATGLVVAKAAGTAKIKIAATDGSKKSATVSITVKKKATTNTNTTQATTQATTQKPGQTTQKPGQSTEKPANPGKPGQSTTETTETPTTEAPAAVEVTGISFKDAKQVMSVDEEQELTVVFVPENATDKQLTFASDNQDVLIVGQNGNVKAVGKGVATITATTKNDVSASVVIAVGNAPTKITLDKETISLAAGKKTKLNAQYEPEDVSDRITWTSSNEQVATVDKDGNVTTVSDGEADITATTLNGLTAICKVTVSTDITSFTVTPDVATIGIGEEEAITLHANVVPGSLKKAVTWSSENAEIATVTEEGKVIGVAKGTTNIIAKLKDKEVKCAITVGEIKTVSDLQSLNDLLANTEGIDQIVYRTESQEKIEIAPGTYDAVELVVDAPNATITNEAKFKRITIQRISENTWIEKAVGNLLALAAKKAHVVVEGKDVAIQVNPGVEEMKLENNGIVDNIAISASAKIVIGGENKKAIPVVSVAEDVVIKTSIPVQLDTVQDVVLNLAHGAESSTVVVVDAEIKATITGIGVITVTNKQTGEVSDVVAENVVDEELATEDVQKGTVTGVVSNVEGTALKDVTISIIPYVVDYNGAAKAELIAKAKEENRYMEGKTGEDGTYSIENIPFGNYLFIYQAEGLQDMTQTVVLNQEKMTNDAITLFEKTEEFGTIVGHLYNALDAKPVAAGITVYLREAADNVTGDVLMETQTDENGAYTFTKVPVGIHTIQVVDNRTNIEVPYVRMNFNVKVLSDETTTVNKTISTNVDSDQVRFVLTWSGPDYDVDDMSYVNEESDEFDFDEDSLGKVPRDLDSHLIGPTADGLTFHTYYSDREFEQNGVRYADLDVDDTTYEGPETTTIYQPVDGEYRFIVHNYTDKEKPEGTRLSTSGAVVKVFRGEQVLATYNVPVGIGTQWNVCSYNAMTHVLTPINTITYVTGNTEYIGLTEEEVQQIKISNARKNLNELCDSFDVSWFGDEVEEELQKKVDEAREIAKTSENVEEIQECQELLSNYYNELRDSLRIELSGENIISYDCCMVGEYDDYTDEKLTEYGIVYVYAEDDIDYSTVTVAPSNEFTTVNMVESDKEGFAAKIEVVNSKNKAKTTYYVKEKEYVPSLYKFEFTDEDNVIVDWEWDWIYEETEDGEEVETREYHVWGENEQLSNPTLKFLSNKIQYQYVPADENEKKYAGYFEISYKDEKVTIPVVYEQRIPTLSIEGFSSEKNYLEYDYDYDYYYDDNDDKVVIYEFKGYLKDLTDDTQVKFNRDDVEYKIVKDEQEKWNYKIIATVKGHEQVFYVNYKQLSVSSRIPNYVSVIVANEEYGTHYYDYSMSAFEDAVVILTDPASLENADWSTFRAEYVDSDLEYSVEEDGEQLKLIVAYNGKVLESIPLYIENNTLNYVSFSCDNKNDANFSWGFGSSADGSGYFNIFSWVKNLENLTFSNSLEGAEVQYEADSSSDDRIGVLKLDYLHQHYTLDVKLIINKFDAEIFEIESDQESYTCDYDEYFDDDLERWFGFYQVTGETPELDLNAKIAFYCGNNDKVEYTISKVADSDRWNYVVGAKYEGQEAVRYINYQQVTQSEED